MLIPGSVKNLSEHEREILAKRLASAGLSAAKVGAATGMGWWNVIGRFPGSFPTRWFSTVMGERRDRLRRQKAAAYMRKVERLIEEAQVW